MPVCQFPCTSYLVQPPCSEDEADTSVDKPREVEMKPVLEGEEDNDPSEQVRFIDTKNPLVAAMGKMECCGRTEKT